MGRPDAHFRDLVPWKTSPLYFNLALDPIVLRGLCDTDSHVTPWLPPKSQRLAPPPDPDRAKAFYRDQLGLPLVSDEQYALVFDAGGTMLRVQKVKEVPEAKYTTLGWNVPDIVAKVEELERCRRQV